MDAYRLGYDLAPILCALGVVLAVAGTVAGTWWALARSRREAARREHRPEPPQPPITAD